MRTVVWTDTVQGIIMVIGLVLILIIVSILRSIDLYSETTFSICEERFDIIFLSSVLNVFC